MCRRIEMFPRSSSTNVKYFTYILIQMKNILLALSPLRISAFLYGWKIKQPWNKKERYHQIIALNLCLMYKRFRY